VDEACLAFLFPQLLGGTQKDDCLVFPKNSIPSTWLPFVEKGVLRLQLDGHDVRLWKPYPFLLDWMRHQCTFIECTDADELRSELSCANIEPEKRKEYCFQRAGMVVLLHAWISLILWLI
jgi:hypothetical protein